MSISVIIPTLNAEKDLAEQLKALSRQTVLADEILVVDSESSDRTVSIAKDGGARVLSVLRKDFDHGRTRDMALRESSGDVVVFLTQDALPADEFFLEHMLRAVSEDRVAVVSGHQMPKADASPIERLIRSYNYPENSLVWSEADIERMGIKAFFCSDACAAYNRKIYLELGGFDYPLKTNEDMFFTAQAIRGGYKAAYSADARVYHSHNFTLKQQYQRNYIQGYEIERHRELLGNASQEKEGIKLFRYVTIGLIRQGRIISFMQFGLDCFARLLGSRAGRKLARSERMMNEVARDQG